MALAKTANHYQKQIPYYEARRTEVQSTITNRLKSTPEQRKQLEHIRIKLYSLNTQMRKARKQEQKLSEINEYLKEFFEVSMWQFKKLNLYIGYQHRLMRNIFIKMVLEEGVAPRRVLQYTGLRSMYGLKCNRRRFTRSLSTKPKNRQAWQDFKQFVYLRRTEN